MKKIIFILSLITTLFLTGCATAPISPRVKKEAKGIYHHVNKGETLLQIAKAYNVDEQQIARANRLSDIDNISIGQLLFIPKTTASLKRNIFRPTHKKENFIWPLKGRICSFYNTFQDEIKNKDLEIKLKEWTRIFNGLQQTIT